MKGGKGGKGGKRGKRIDLRSKLGEVYNDGSFGENQQPNGMS